MKKYYTVNICMASGEEYKMKFAKFEDRSIEDLSEYLLDKLEKNSWHNFDDKMIINGSQIESIHICDEETEGVEK